MSTNRNAQNELRHAHRHLAAAQGAEPVLADTQTALENMQEKQGSGQGLLWRVIACFSSQTPTREGSFKDYEWPASRGGRDRVQRLSLTEPNYTALTLYQPNYISR